MRWTCLIYSGHVDDSEPPLLQPCLGSKAIFPTKWGHLGHLVSIRYLEPNMLKMGSIISSPFLPVPSLPEALVLHSLLLDIQCGTNKLQVLSSPLPSPLQGLRSQEMPVLLALLHSLSFHLVVC